MAQQRMSSVFTPRGEGTGMVFTRHGLITIETLMRVELPVGHQLTEGEKAELAKIGYVDEGDGILVLHIPDEDYRGDRLYDTLNLVRPVAYNSSVTPGWVDDGLGDFNEVQDGEPTTSMFAMEDGHSVGVVISQYDNLLGMDEAAGTITMELKGDDDSLRDDLLDLGFLFAQDSVVGVLTVEAGKMQETFERVLELVNRVDCITDDGEHVNYLAPHWATDMVADEVA